MKTRQRRYPIDEIARRGTELYERSIGPIVDPGNDGRILCIDIESGAYALADDPLDASEELIGKNPDAQIWCLRIGHVAVDRLGFRTTTEIK